MECVGVVATPCHPFIRRWGVNLEQELKPAATNAAFELLVAWQV